MGYYESRQGKGKNNGGHQMTTQEYLRQVEKLDAVIKNKQERVEYLRATLLGKGIDYSSERVKTSPQDRFSATISEYLDEEKKISRLLVQLLEKRNEIVLEIEHLNTKYYNVLYMRYVKMMQFKEIMDEMHISEQTVFKYHRKALQEFEKLWGDKYMKK